MPESTIPWRAYPRFAVAIEIRSSLLVRDHGHFCVRVKLSPELPGGLQGRDGHQGRALQGAADGPALELGPDAGSLPVNHQEIVSKKTFGEIEGQFAISHTTGVHDARAGDGSPSGSDGGLTYTIIDHLVHGQKTDGEGFGLAIQNHAENQVFIGKIRGLG